MLPMRPDRTVSVTDCPIEQAAKHWNTVTQQSSNLVLRWWQHPRILSHVNRLICGERAEGIVGGDLARLRNLGASTRFRNAVSIGCGTGHKEIALVRGGVVESFDLYEVSEERISRGLHAIERAGLTAQIRYHKEIVDFEQGSIVKKFDLVYWNNSLHHMLDTAAALEWSKHVLAKGGCLYVNDYIGPNRMQFDDDMIRIACDVRALLPSRLLSNPRSPEQSLPREVQRPDEAALIALDPTECADSAAILPSVSRIFPGSEVRMTGGAVYHLALNDLIHNFCHKDDDALLDCLLLLDETCARAGISQYGLIIAEQ